IPAIDVVRAQSNLSTQEQTLHVAENLTVVRENALKDALSWHGRQDPDLEAAHIIPVDPLVVPEADRVPALTALLETARANRADLAIARTQEEIAQITAYGTANGVLPALRVSASASNVGQAGTPVAGQQPDGAFIGGVGTALTQMFTRD